MIDNTMRDEILYTGKTLIIDTAVIGGGPGCLTYETIAMWADTHQDIDCVRTHDREEAERNHAHILEKWRGAEEFRRREEAKKNAPAPLTGRYAKLRDDLKTAFAATEHLEQTEDGGTCNFDAPALFLPRWNGAKIEQAAKEAGGVGAWKWDLWGRSRWVISFKTSGQANRRSRRADAIAELLRGMGYDCTEYCAMD